MPLWRMRVLFEDSAVAEETTRMATRRKPPDEPNAVEEYIDYVVYNGFVCKRGFCTLSGNILAEVTGERWILPAKRFHAFCRKRKTTAMRAMDIAEEAGTKVQKIPKSYVVTLPAGFRSDTAHWRRKRDVLGEYMLHAVFGGLVSVDGMQRGEGKALAYVTDERWMIPKELFHRFCRKMKFYPGWVMENARARGESIEGGPNWYVIAIRKLMT